MHTLTCGKTIFNFNADLSGDVDITTPDGRRFQVPGGDLVSFVADYVRRQKIEELEQAETLEILCLPRAVT